MPLTEAEARARLERMLSWTDDPALSEAEITDLLSLSAIPDANGLEPDNDDWAGAWHLNLGAAEGWRWKAGKVASRYDFSSDVNNFRRDQLYQHCVDMSERYRRGRAGTIDLATPSLYDPVIANLNGAA